MRSLNLSLFRARAHLLGLLYFKSSVVSKIAVDGFDNVVACSAMI